MLIYRAQILFLMKMEYLISSSIRNFPSTTKRIFFLQSTPRKILSIHSKKGEINSNQEFNVTFNSEKLVQNPQLIKQWINQIISNQDYLVNQICKTNKEKKQIHKFCDKVKKQRRTTSKEKKHSKGNTLQIRQSTHSNDILKLVMKSNEGSDHEL